jgi:hypothetical protein
MCEDAFTEPVEALALLMAESLGSCPQCGCVVLLSGVVERSCPPRPFVRCSDCGHSLA